MNTADHQAIAAIICGDTKFRCICTKEPDHEGPHLCDCYGSWDHDGDVITFPNPTRIFPRTATGGQ